MTIQAPTRDAHATHRVAVRFWRFACPHCGKVLKVRAEVAEGGVRGICPVCRGEAEFAGRAAENSRMGRELLKIVTEGEGEFPREQVGRLALLLSLGTCRDYTLAAELLDGRALSAKQWRSILREAAVRETMRRRVEESVLGDSPRAETISWCEASACEQTACGGEGAWQVMARFMHHQRRGDCAKCRENPTGLSCVHLDFEGFLEECDIGEKRAERWRRVVMAVIGV